MFQLNLFFRNITDERSKEIESHIHAGNFHVWKMDPNSDNFDSGHHTDPYFVGSIVCGNDPEPALIELEKEGLYVDALWSGPEDLVEKACESVHHRVGKSTTRYHRDDENLPDSVVELAWFQ